MATPKKRGRPPKNRDSDSAALLKQSLEAAEKGRAEISAKKAISPMDPFSIPQATNEPVQISIDAPVLIPETGTIISEAQRDFNLRKVEETLETMTGTFDMTDAMILFPERRADLAEFESLCRKLVIAYSHSLLLYQDADQRARERVRKLLESKDKIIMDLQTTLAQREQELESIANAYSVVERERDAAAAETETLRQAARNEVNVAKKLDDLQKLVNKAFKATVSAS